MPNHRKRDRFFYQTLSNGPKLLIDAHAEILASGWIISCFYLNNQFRDNNHDNVTKTVEVTLIHNWLQEMKEGSSLIYIASLSLDGK
jgi:hypothetical protein